MVQTDRSQPLNQLPILLVESEEDSAALLTFMLELEGASVQVADSFSQAVQVLEKFKPGLLITSLRLSDASGYLLLQYLRSLEGNSCSSAIPAIAVVESLRDVMQEEMRSAGFQGYVAKPVLSISLLSSVTSLPQFESPPENTYQLALRGDDAYFT